MNPRERHVVSFNIDDTVQTLRDFIGHIEWCLENISAVTGAEGAADAMRELLAKSKGLLHEQELSLNKFSVPTDEFDETLYTSTLEEKGPFSRA